MSTKRLVEQAGAKRLILAKEGNVIMYEISAKHCVIYNNKQCAYQGNKLFGRKIFNNLVIKND